MKKVFIVFFLMCFLVIIFIGNLFAQADVHNTGILYVTTGTDVYVENSFTNAATASLTNNGVLNVRQHVSNSQASMAVGTGTLLLNGSSMQNINGSQVFKTNNLVTDNTAGFTLNNDLSVSGLHTFTNGLITSSATPNYMIYEAGSSYTGSNDNNHVYGWVKKLGTTGFIFPVGSNLYERPIELSSLGSNSEFAVRHNGAVTPNYTSLYGTLVLVDTSEYWTVNRISGSSAVVTMHWDHTKIPVPQVLITNVRATYWDGTFWTSIGGTGVGDISTTGSVTSNSTTAFNTDFTIGSIGLVLPLQLVSFTAQRNNAINEIKWVVANERGIKNYILQRSDDGINFYNISTQNALNNTANAVQYTYNDAAFMNTKVYYRLKYADVSGLDKYSGIISVNAANDGNKEFYLVNNPVSEKIDMFISAAYKGAYIYTLAGTSGQVVQTGVVNITGSGIYSIPLRSSMATGMYVLSLNNAQNKLQKNILKQ